MYVAVFRATRGSDRYSTPEWERKFLSSVARMAWRRIEAPRRRRPPSDTPVSTQSTHALGRRGHPRSPGLEAHEGVEVGQLASVEVRVVDKSSHEREWWKQKEPGRWRAPRGPIAPSARRLRSGRPPRPKEMRLRCGPMTSPSRSPSTPGSGAVCGGRSHVGGGCHCRVPAPHQGRRAATKRGRVLVP